MGGFGEKANAVTAAMKIVTLAVLTSIPQPRKELHGNA